MSACCKSKLTSGRHLSISFVRSLLRHVIFLCLWQHVQWILSFPAFLIFTLANTVLLIVIVTYPCMPAACLSVKYTSVIWRASKYKKDFHLLYVSGKQMTSSALCFLWLKHHATRSCLYLSLFVIYHPLLAVTHTCNLYRFCPSQIIKVAISYCSTTLKRAWLTKQSTELLPTV